MTFRETLEKHLRAIQSRDLPALLQTLPAKHLTLVMSDGRFVQSVSEFAALHEVWFASSSWSLEAEVMQTVEGSDLGLALVRLTYRDSLPDGKQIRQASFLSLAFQHQSERWLMVHDQNTPIKEPC